MEDKLILGAVELSAKKKDDRLILSLPQADTSLRNTQELQLLNQDKNYFIQADAQVQDENLEFHYLLTDMRFFEQIKQLDREHKLRMLFNIGRFSSMLNGRTTLVLHPDNLVFDINLMPYMLYRGIKNILPPFQHEEGVFLKAYKCLAIATFSKEFKFDDLMNGAYERAKQTSFEKAVHQSQNVEELQALLKKYYEEEHKKAAQKFEKVSKAQFKGFKIATIALGVVSIVLISLVLYAFSSKIPTEELYNQANASYINENYIDVKESLKDQKIEDIPKSIKKIYAISSIKTSLQEEEKQTNAINSISSISDERLLNYWIDIARNDFNGSLKIAKSLDVNDLKKFSIILYENQLKKNTKMNQQEKEDKLKDLEVQLNEITEEEAAAQEAQESETQKAAEEKQKQIEAQEKQKVEKRKKQSKDKQDKKTDKE